MISVFLFAVLISTVQAATLGGFEPEFYGFIKASAMFSDKALASYNNINLSAPTHTRRPKLALKIKYLELVFKRSKAEWV